MARERAGISHEEKLRQIQEQKRIREQKRNALTNKKTAQNRGKSLGQSVMDERVGATASRRNIKFMTNEEVDDMIEVNNSVIADSHTTDTVTDDTDVFNFNDIFNEVSSVDEQHTVDSVAYASVIHDTVTEDIRPGVTVNRDSVADDSVSNVTIINDSVSCVSVTSVTVDTDTQSDNSVPIDSVANDTVLCDSPMDDTLFRNSVALDTISHSSDTVDSLMNDTLYPKSVSTYTVANDSVFTFRSIEIITKLKNSDLSANELRLLLAMIIVINKSWDTGVKLSLIEIADMINSDTSNCVRLLKGLVTKGYIIKRKGESDDRKNTYLINM